MGRDNSKLENWVRAVELQRRIKVQDRAQGEWQIFEPSGRRNIFCVNEHRVVHDTMDKSFQKSSAFKSSGMFYTVCMSDECGVERMPKMRMSDYTELYTFSKCYTVKGF
jgi:hypothetical protein